MRKYKLVERQVVPVDDDTREWAEWFEAADRRVALDVVGGATVSTVFLGLDHDFLGHGPPLVFETMAFEDGKPWRDECERSSTWHDAELAHAAMLARVVAAVGN